MVRAISCSLNVVDGVAETLDSSLYNGIKLNTKLLNYGTAKDQMPTAAIMDRAMIVLGLCFGTLKEGDHSAYNVAFHEFMVDYNNRDDIRMTPKP